MYEFHISWNFFTIGKSWHLAIAIFFPLCLYCYVSFLPQLSDRYVWCSLLLKRYCQCLLWEKICLLDKVLAFWRVMIVKVITYFIEHIREFSFIYPQVFLKTSSRLMIHCKHENIFYSIKLWLYNNFKYLCNYLFNYAHWWAVIYFLYYLILISECCNGTRILE